MKKGIILIGGALLMSLGVKAQIVHTDINPDITSNVGQNMPVANDIAPIDFNGDGTPEYDFRWDAFGTTEFYVHITYQNGNTVNLKGAAMNPFGARYVQAMAANEAINTGLNWGASDPEPLLSDQTDINFKGLGDRYIGVRFMINNSVHFGWILVSFSNNNMLQIKEYAYNATPNTAILAGDKGGPVNIKESQKVINKLMTYPNPVTDVLRFENMEGAEVIAIVDISGKICRQYKLSQGANSIDMSNFNPGTYFLKFSKNGKLFSISKVIKK